MKAIAAILNLVPGWVWAIAVAALVFGSVTLTLELAGARVELATSRTDVATLKQAIADATAKAATQSAELSNTVLKAQNDAKIREALLRTAAAAASSESDGLRDDLAAMRVQFDQLSRDAVAQRAVTVGILLSECAARYSKLASTADSHANDLRTLIDAWPH